MNTIEFTEKEKETIAEFVHGHESDTLIVPEATNLIEVLAKHKLITDREIWLKKVQDKTAGFTDDLMLLLKTKISDEQGTAIMHEYYGTKPEEKKEESKVKDVEQQQHYNWGVGKDA